MTSEQVKSIALADVFRILNLSPDQQKNHADENVIEFVQAYLHTQGVDHEAVDAERWLANIFGYAPSIQPIPLADQPVRNKNLTVKAAKKITHPFLIRYLKDQGIPLDLASAYLKQITIAHKQTGKSAYAIGFKNESGGYEAYSSELPRMTIGRGDISFIRGTVPKPDGIHIFKDDRDYLSAVQHKQGRRFKEDSLILNSLYYLPKATAYIKGYGYKTVQTWMPNNEAGRQATRSMAAFFKTEENLLHYPMNDVYGTHETVNRWHMDR